MRCLPKLPKLVVALLVQAGNVFAELFAVAIGTWKLLISDVSKLVIVQLRHIHNYKQSPLKEKGHCVGAKDFGDI